jgi:hypothetical protein
VGVSQPFPVAEAPPLPPLLFSPTQISVAIGSTIPVLITNLILPWYLSQWALEKTGESYCAGARLIGQQYLSLVRTLGGPQMPPPTPRAHTMSRKPTGAQGATPSQQARRSKLRRRLVRSLSAALSHAVTAPVAALQRLRVSLAGTPVTLSPPAAPLPVSDGGVWEPRAASLSISNNRRQPEHGQLGIVEAARGVAGGRVGSDTDQQASKPQDAHGGHVLATGSVSGSASRVPHVAIVIAEGDANPAQAAAAEHAPAGSGKLGAQEPKSSGAAGGAAAIGLAPAASMLRGAELLLAALSRRSVTMSARGDGHGPAGGAGGLLSPDIPSRAVGLGAGGKACTGDGTRSVVLPPPAQPPSLASAAKGHTGGSPGEVVSSRRALSLRSVSLGGETDRKLSRRGSSISASQARPVAFAQVSNDLKEEASRAALHA